MRKIRAVIIMPNKLKDVSMNGRMAYVIMCVEAYLANKYPDRDWSLVCKKMWEATSTNWGAWSDMFSCIIPDVLLQYDEYPDEDFDESLSKKEFLSLKKIYAGITNGIEDDSEDELNYMLNKLFEMAMVYEGTTIGDGEKSFEIIDNAEQVLTNSGIELPDYTKVMFSAASELNGWGNDFNGNYLSIILKYQDDLV